MVLRSMEENETMKGNTQCWVNTAIRNTVSDQRRGHSSQQKPETGERAGHGAACRKTLQAERAL